MPNHVTNKLIFDAVHGDHVFETCFKNDKFDFNTLIPQPPHVYNGDLSSEDEQDFKCNWMSWNIENWGTKWNAYDTSWRIEDGKAIITFDTAWRVPYPVIVAFANKFGIPFEHRYFDEGHNFWGVETWGTERGVISRNGKRKSNEGDRKSLCIELKGYDPDETEDA